MTKKSFFHLSVATSIGLLAAGSAHAADYDAATAYSPAQILIKNALVNTALGSQHASIHLVAKDHKNLHRGQVYQGHFGTPNAVNGEDGSYNEADEVIYVRDMTQAGALSHQAVLKCVNRQRFECTILEVTTTVVKQPQDLFFNSGSVHKVRLNEPPRL